MGMYELLKDRAVDKEQADAKHNQHAFVWMTNNYMQYSGFVPTEEMYDQWYTDENWNKQACENYPD